MFNAARRNIVADRVEEDQHHHLPMLRWVVSTAKKRMEKGRIVILENGWRSFALSLDCMNRFIDFPDGLVPEASFQGSRGDHCMLGQRDKENGLPYHAYTAWGTNSVCIREALSVECGRQREH